MRQFSRRIAQKRDQLRRAVPPQSFAASAPGQYHAALAAAKICARAVPAARRGHPAIFGRVPGVVVLALLQGAEIYRSVSRPWPGADREAALPAVRFPFWDAAAEQSHYQLLKSLSQPGDRVPADAARALSDDFPLEIYRVHVVSLVGVPVFDRAVAGGLWPE